MSQGSIQHHTYGVDRGGSTSTVVSFRVTHSMVPKVKVLGFFARDDGELVADLIELEIRCDLQNRVGVGVGVGVDGVSICTCISYFF